MIGILRSRRSIVLAAACILGGLLPLALNGCGGNSQEEAPDLTVVLTPAVVTLAPLGTQTFSVQVLNTTNQSVTWQVDEGTTGGTVTSAGVYTAPATAGTYHVTATSVADTKWFSTATVTVQDGTSPSPSPSPSASPTGVTVTLSPTSAALAPNTTQQFTATVTNATNTAVTWSVQEGSTGGTITNAGLYTAPNVEGTYHVLATSAADATVTASATITVQSTGNGVVTVQ